MSVTLMVACLLQRFQFEPLHGMKVAYDITLNFQKTGGLHMRVQPRPPSSRPPASAAPAYDQQVSDARKPDDGQIKSSRAEVVDSRA